MVFKWEYSIVGILLLLLEWSVFYLELFYCVVFKWRYSIGSYCNNRYLNVWYSIGWYSNAGIQLGVIVIFWYLNWCYSIGWYLNGGI